MTILPVRGKNGGHVHEGGEWNTSCKVLANPGVPTSGSVCEAEKMCLEVERSTVDPIPLPNHRCGLYGIGNSVVVSQHAALSDEGRKVLRVSPRGEMQSRCRSVLAGSPVRTTGRMGIFVERESACVSHDDMRGGVQTPTLVSAVVTMCVSSKLNWTACRRACTNCSSSLVSQLSLHVFPHDVITRATRRVFPRCATAKVSECVIGPPWQAP